MEGDLNEFQLSDILQFVSFGSRSGVLEILRTNGVHRINFTAGVITGLSAAGWSISEALLESNLVPQEVLDGLDLSNQADLRGPILAGSYMSAEDWNAFIARQVESLLYRLFDSRHGKFRFRQIGTIDFQWLPVKITTNRAVLEGTRWSETWSQVDPALRAPEARFGSSGTRPDAAVKLSPTQWRVFVASREPGSLNQLATRAMLSEVESLEALRALTGHGLVAIL